jgi:hypothetical protein
MNKDLCQHSCIHGCSDSISCYLWLISVFKMCSLVYPPIVPLGFDDLYPHRYVFDHEHSCTMEPSYIVNCAFLFCFVCSGIGGGGSMHVGNITFIEHILDFSLCNLH